MTNNADLKVAFVIQTFHPAVGGAEAQLLALLPLMKAQGIQPLVITRGLPDEPARDEVNGFSIRRCGSYRHGLVGSVGFFFGALWHIRGFKPDIVHAFSLMTPSTIASVYRAVTGVPMVVKSLRGGLQGDLDRISHKKFYTSRRWMLNRSIDAAQVISAEIDNEFEQMGLAREKRHRISNGVNLRRISAADAGQSYREELSIPPTANVYAFVGRLASEKRVGLLIDAFAQGFADDDEAWLVIAGSGPERDALLEQAASLPRVILLGSSDRVAQLLSEVSVFILPSITEGMSNSMLEAMAASLPIIATDVGAAGELLGQGPEAGERGILVSPDNTEELRDAMLALRTQTDREQLGVRAREYVVLHHSLEGTGNQLVAMYQQCTERT